MFGKLIKNEFRNTWKLMGIINIALLLMHLVLHCLELMNNSGFFTGNSFNVIHKTYMVTYVLGIIGANVAVTLYLLARYYRKVYSNEGYLTHTLPVTKAQITGAMLISGVVWSIVTLIISSLYAVAKLLSDVIKAALIWSQRIDISGITVSLLVINAISAVILFYMMAFLSISIGQNWKAHPTLGAIISYVALNMLMQTVTVYLIVILSNIGLFDWVSDGINLKASAINTLSGINIAGFLIDFAVLFAINNFIMKRRLNL